MPDARCRQNVVDQSELDPVAPPDRTPGHGAVVGIQLKPMGDLFGRPLDRDGTGVLARIPAEAFE
ncbi:hypothetical protein ABZS61_10170 [Streptomyces sp. NPDC005566]|uniref:hypothetical protein n=1 Tax=Streptomyces sp. NPDC005566 TaxID=3156886 RepID=UPI0033AC6E93